eukprot:scaffold5639_cov70-Cyclotella_meneghiniana.AAC.3
MNKPVPSSEDSRLDEWGKYIKKSEDVIRIDDDGVLEAIRNNNPAITAVEVHAGGDDGEISNWGAVGRYLRQSKHVKHLAMNFFGIIDSLDLQSFCDGLAVNKSVESLEIYLDIESDFDDDGNEVDNEQERLIRSFPSELIRNLLPFFKNNYNLVAVDFSFFYQQDLAVNSISDLVSASSSLKSVKIKWRGHEHNLEHLIMVICKRVEVRHITIDEGFLNKGACLEIEKFLSGEHCQLKSFSFSDVELTDNACFDNIINGIFNNKSLECLQMPSREHTRSFLKLLRHTKLSSIRKLIFTPTKLPTITSLCHQLPNVSSLSILTTQDDLYTKYKFSKSMWGKSCPEQDQASSSTLQELLIDGFVARESHIEELNSCLSNHSMLKSLGLYRSWRDDFGMGFDIFQSIPIPQLDSISTLGLIISDSVMTSFCNWVSRIPTLRVLDISSCRNVSLEGWQLLSTLLVSLPIIKEVDFASITTDVNGVPDGVPDTILHALLAKSTLKKASFNISRINQLWAVANALQNPECSLTELKIGYSTGRNLTEREREQFSQLVVSALQRNATLKILEFETDQYEDDDFYNWALFCDLLCNKSSIDATYLSNHTLQSLPINSHYVNTLPFEIYSMLHLNKLKNKHTVAREKILQHHKLEDVNFVPSSLPVAMSWIGKSNSNLGLSQQYRLIRSAPHLIQNDHKKRKRDG